MSSYCLLSRDGFLGGTIGLQVLVNASRHFSAFRDRPYDEGSTTLGVAAGKDAVKVGHKVVVDRNTTPSVVCHTKAVEQAVLHGAGETHGQQHQIHIHLQF